MGSPHLIKSIFFYKPNVEANSKCPYFGNSFEIDTKADTAGDDGVLWGFVRGNGCALILLLKD